MKLTLSCPRLKYIQNKFYCAANLKDKQLEKNKRDLIGPADQISNLRPVIFAKPDNETHLEKEYREAREATQKWNQHFWTEHNIKFIQERKEFQRKLQEEQNKSANADEMSVFYKKFLDKNWRTHLEYNVSWYRQNLRILLLELRVKLSKFKFK